MVVELRDQAFNLSQFQALLNVQWATEPSTPPSLYASTSTFVHTTTETTQGD